MTGNGSDPGPPFSESWARLFALDSPHHTCIVTHDLHDGLEALSHYMDVQRTFTYEAAWRCSVHGKETKFALRIVYVACGMQRIQVVQPLDDRSPHAVVLTNRGPGLSHTCYVVPALRERIKSMKTAIDARLYRFAEFLDPAVLTAWAFFTESSLARYPIELIDDSSDSRDFFRLVDDAIDL